jgi:sarcosine oxidase subunit gamma
VADHLDHPLDALPFDRIAPAGHYGLAGATGVTATRLEGLAIATLQARNGAGAALVERLQQAFTPAFIDAPRVVASGNAVFIGTGPARWLALSDEEAELAASLARAAGPLASVNEQSDGFVVFELTGAKVPDTLAKGALIDLDPRVFQIGDAATTVLAHLGVTLWRTGEERWRVLVGRSFHAAFCRFLIASAAEYGLELEGRG